MLQVDVWDHARSEPVSTFHWGAESALSVRFNPVSPSPHSHAACNQSCCHLILSSCSAAICVGLSLMHGGTAEKCLCHPVHAFPSLVGHVRCCMHQLHAQESQQVHWLTSISFGSIKCGQHHQVWCWWPVTGIRFASHLAGLEDALGI